jgi:hypothetical protein
MVRDDDIGSQAVHFDIKRCVVFDVEVYPNRWLVGFDFVDRRGRARIRQVDGDLDRLRVALRWFARNGYTLVSFNGIRYDVRILRAILGGLDPHAVSTRIIEGDRGDDGRDRARVRAELKEMLAGCPRVRCDHVDLAPRMPRTSLKLIAAHMGRRRLQELPYDPHADLDEGQWEEVGRYNLKDLSDTRAFLDAVAPDLQSLVALSNEYGQDFRSLPSPRVGEAIVRSIYRDGYGSEPPCYTSGERVTYRALPGVVRPRSPEAGDWFDKVVGVPLPIDHAVGPRRSVDHACREDPAVIALQDRRTRPRIRIPKPYVAVGDLRLRVGEGGLHSADGMVVHRADAEHRLVDLDATSYYPSLIVVMGIMTDHFGDVGREGYRRILDERVRLKAAAKDATGEEKARIEARADGLKLIVNSFFGKFGDPFSCLYDPAAKLAVTITGQLLLIDLIERLQATDVQVVTVNTDGFVCRFRRDNPAFDGVVTRWQADTGMTLEARDIERIALCRANNYAVLGRDGKVKHRGSTFRAEFAACTSRSAFTAPNQLIVGRAVADALLRDIPPETTIGECRDLRLFCRVIKRTPSVERRVIGEPGGPEEPLPKIVRFYHARGSRRRIKDYLRDGRTREGRTRAGVELAMDVPAGLDGVLVDRSAYVRAARRIVQDVRDYPHLDPAMLGDHDLALQVYRAGLYPVPKWTPEGEGVGKAVLPGCDPKRPTFLWPWAGIETVGTYTGPDLGILAVDVDDPKVWARKVARLKRPAPWEGLDGCLVSSHGDATADAVRRGEAKGKLIFRFAGDAAGRIAKMTIKKYAKKLGVEVFFGKGCPSVLGQYDDEGDRYRLDGQLGEPPGWLVGMITPPEPRKRGPRQGKAGATTDAAPSADESGRVDFGPLKGTLHELESRLDPEGWTEKDLVDGPAIVAPCPYDHESGRHGNADLIARYYPDGPRVRCLHNSCEGSRELNARLRGQAGGEPRRWRQRLPEPDAKIDRRDVEVTVRRHEVLQETLKALPLDPDLYVRGNCLGVVVRETGDTMSLPGGVELGNAAGSYRFAPLPAPVIGCRITRVADFWRAAVDKNGEPTSVDVHPPQWLVAAVANHTHYPGVPAIRYITSCPFIGEDGGLSEPGYDRTTGTLFVPNFDLLALPEDPARGDAMAAAMRIAALVEQFPFETPGDGVAWLAYFLTIVARPPVLGPVPGFPFVANGAGCGKDLLIDLGSTLAFGCVAPSQSLPVDPKEFQKVILALALGAIPIVHFNNLDEGSTYGGGDWDGVLTSAEWQGRILGMSKVTESIPLNIIWTLSGNNVMMAGDSERRWIPCNLKTELEEPYERKDLIHPDLLGHARDRRAEFVRDALIILKAHADAGHPRPDDWPFLGSFEKWDRIVRAAVWYATDQDCVATQRAARFDKQDRRTKLNVIEGWLEIDPQSRGKTAREALKMLRDTQYKKVDPYPKLRSAFLDWSRDSELPSDRIVGNRLRPMKNKILGRLKFVKAEVERDNLAVWRVLKADES